jgi:hypothetical protein
MVKVRHLAIAAAVLAGGGAPAVALTAGTPAGASTSTLSTTYSVKTLISARCYKQHQVTITNFAWSSKAGHYVRYPAPRKTVTDSTHCK